MSFGATGSKEDWEKRFRVRLQGQKGCSNQPARGKACSQGFGIDITQLMGDATTFFIFDEEKDTIAQRSHQKSHAEEHT